MKKKLLAVLAGNPNSGKSTIFNRLTGAKQSIGNFPGVTVERYEGRADYEDFEIDIVDLPGLYSLDALTDEERVAGDYLVHEQFDVIINIVDASHLERNLYLTLLLRELHRPMLVVLNMADVARRHGSEIDTARLSRELGVPVLETVASRGTGVREILAQIVQMRDEVGEKGEDRSENKGDVKDNGVCDKKGENDWNGDNEKKEINGDNGGDKGDKTKRAPKSGEGDEKSVASREADFVPSETGHGGRGGHGGCNRLCEGGCACCRAALTLQTQRDVARYREIGRIGVRCVRNVIPLERSVSDRVDTVLTNRWLGIPIFLLAMFVVFQLTFTLGQYPMDQLEAGFGWLSETLGRVWPEGNFLFLKSLVIDGVIGGVGGVLVFLPNILLLFLAISLLEDSGYMARAALLSDRWMHRIGLPGKSIVPLLVGFGCTVPALMATRMLNDRRERLTTMFVLPLFSCGARFPIYALLIPAFFPPAWRGPVLWLIYFIGVALAAVTAKILSAVLSKGEEATFIIELPPYHFPTFRTVGIRTLERGWQYLKKAGTVILGISIVLWFLTTYPSISPSQSTEFVTMRNEARNGLSGETLAERLSEIDHAESQTRLTVSFAGRFGHFMEPILKPMGFDWKIGTALVGAVAAKEVFVAQMGIVYSVGDDQENEAGLTDLLARHYSPLAGFCVMLFCLIATPCMATFVMTAKESGSWKWGVGQWLFLTALAWVLTTVTYQVGTFFFG